MTGKTVLAVLAAGCLLLQWYGLRSALAYGDYRTFVQEEISQGRMEVGDIDRIEPFLSSTPGFVETLDPDALHTRAILQVYNMDLAAISKGVLPLHPSKDPDITKARETAFESLKSVLSKAPHNGELWMRMAFVATALDRQDAEVATYIHLSKTTAPHEGWIQARRDLLSRSSQ
jgi:hypothetical protein